MSNSANIMPGLEVAHNLMKAVDKSPYYRVNLYSSGFSGVFVGRGSTVVVM